MSLTRQQFWKIAIDIRNQLFNLKQTKQRQVHVRITGLIEQMNRLVTIRRKLNLCDIRNWQAAGERILRQAASALQDIPFQIQQTEQAIQACRIVVPSVSDIYRELVQLEDEFDGLTYHKEGNLLAVTTEPIELDGVYLGEFEIQLHLPSFAEMQYNSLFRIYAIDPHPAACNDSVTHPHVSDERLCSGDAGAAINMALTTGRICDFFLLVRSVLTNYNPESPYVSLDAWSGTACYECGYVVNGDDICWCGSCENEFCSSCSSYCRNCDESACLGCLTECSVCDELTCSTCMTTCPECGENLCKKCLDDMACPCIEENLENENEDGENDENETTTVATSDTTEKRDSSDIVHQVTGATETTVNIDAA